MDPHPRADAILEDIVDPPNRYVRYPLARALLPLAMRTPVTPNQITAFHALIGIASGVLIARGSTTELVLAFFLGELRMVLDCLDGVVARAKKLFSPNGRTIDELGDAVGYVAMQIGVYFNLRARNPEKASILVLVVAILLPGLMALGYDFYKRKFTAALVKGTDTIVDDLVRRDVSHHRDGGGFIVVFGRIVDRIQLLFFSPRSLGIVHARVANELAGGPHLPPPLDEVRGIRAAADRGELPWILRLIGWTTGDNCVTMLHFFLLAGTVVHAQYAIIGGGLSMLVLCSIACQTFLRRATAAGCESAARGAS